MSVDPVKARQRARRWAERNPERTREWRKAHPERVAALTKAWVARNPEKRQAQIAVGNALRDGRLVRPGACQACGDVPSPNARGASRIEAHHEDYTRPLDVLWLCKPCHKGLHRRDGNG